MLRGPGPLDIVYEKGEGSGFAPAFKILDWAASAPERVSVNGDEVPCVSAVVEGRLVLQVLGTIEGAKALVTIGK